MARGCGVMLRSSHAAPRPRCFHRGRCVAWLGGHSAGDPGDPTDSAGLRHAAVGQVEHQVGQPGSSQSADEVLQPRSFRADDQGRLATPDEFGDQVGEGLRSTGAGWCVDAQMPPGGRSSDNRVLVPVGVKNQVLRRRGRRCRGRYHSVAITKLISPILPHTADEVWKYIPGVELSSVQLAELPEVDSSLYKEELENKWNSFLDVTR